MSENFLKLKVIESLQEDIDKGIVRLTNETMDKLGIVSGDLIEIKEKSSVVLKALRSIKKESSEDIIRLDGTTRSNIGASMGDYVEVSKEITVNEAKNITLSPNQEGIRFSDDPKEYFHTKLLN